jgi:hypothetical protein
MVEQLTLNQRVVGSSPTRFTNSSQTHICEIPPFQVLDANKIERYSRT